MSNNIFSAMVRAISLVFVLALLPLVVFAQSADIPRLSNGQPDFNGMWDRPRVSDISRDTVGCGSGSVGCSSISNGPLEFTAAGLAEFNGPRIDWPASCLPWGYIRAYQTSYPVMYSHTPDNFVVLFESNNVFHIVPTDGREHPEEVETTWMGKSVGRFEGDTLVIDSRGFNGMSWLDQGAEHPGSDEMHVIERIRHIDADTLEYILTIEDPKYYSKPIVNTRIFVRMAPDAEIYEYWCMENNKDLLEGLSPAEIPAEIRSE